MNYPKTYQVRRFGSPRIFFRTKDITLAKRKIAEILAATVATDGFWIEEI